VASIVPTITMYLLRSHTIPDQLVGSLVELSIMYEIHV